MRKKVEVGKIIIPQKANPSAIEIETAKILVKGGQDIEFITPCLTKGVKSPDIVYLGKKWEIKCPTGDGRWTILEQLRRAARQSPNVILDLRKTKLSLTEVRKQIDNHFAKHKNIDQIILIAKNGLLLVYSK